MVASTEFWSGISTAFTSSMEPDEPGRLWVKTTMAEITRIRARPIASTLGGGRFRLAVPNSSPMLMVGPASGAGAAGVSGLAVDPWGTGLSSTIAHTIVRVLEEEGVRFRNLSVKSAT